MGELNQVLHQYARQLNASADAILKIRVGTQKGFLDKLMLAREVIEEGRDSDQYKACYVDGMRRFKDADAWRNMAYSEEHFNWKFFDPEGTASLEKDWEERDGARISI